MDLNIETNMITKMLGQESDIANLDEAVAFFFALSVTRSVKGQYVSKFLRTMIRMYGALAFVMPLILAGLPSDMMRNMDDYARVVVTAMVVDAVIPFDAIHPVLGNLVDRCCSLSYAIMKANACAAGYAAFGNAFAGSIMAPFLGAFVATNGHRFIENGMKAFEIKLAGDNDAKVAVCGGLILWAATTQLGASALVARASLAAMNVSQEYVNYDNVLSQVTGVANSLSASVAGGITKATKGGKRGRSRTPSMKK